MPELPEVETVARQLAEPLEGRVVRRITIHDTKLRLDRPRRVSGMTVKRVHRSGKQVIVTLIGKKDHIWLAVHLRMTGRLIWVESSGRVSRRPHERARIVTDAGVVLFLDTRRFGTMRLHDDEAETAPPGLEPLSKAFTSHRLRRLIGASTTPIKVWLLRQDRLVGIGNIYASEILFAAGIDPRREARSLDDDEFRRVHRATRRILRRAIENCGTTFSDFQDARGVEGGYRKYLAVYARDGEGCRRCGGNVEKLVQQQRTTFFCAGCQK